ncbi:retrovirus-related pol polyprotein from transposon TNT 1-94 [Tanacetum coccineum]|uniref:Retrovirus-related pol polyprotein from transposon TNT 1-94 n=1 Tax=Tanacetum coccineum TaxID=301880 RepID=A0ABQ5IP66_9ASTR
MQKDVQPNCVVDSDTKYTSDSNIILYEQYVKDNAEQVVQSNVSFMPNDSLMMIINDMHEQDAQCVSANKHNKVVNVSLTAEITRYKEQFKNYEKRARFSEMHDAYTVEQARVVELKAEISKLKHKIQKDDHSEMINHFSNLEVDHLNLQLKYQHLKDSFGNNKSQTSQAVPEFDLFFEINKLKEQLQGKDNTIRNLKEKISQLKETRILAPGMYAIDVEPILPHNRNNREVHLDYLKHLKESVEILCEIVEEAKIEKPLDNAIGNACFYTKQSHEFLEYVIGTCLKEFNKSDKKVATTPLNRKKQVIFKVISSTEASGSNPRSNTKNNRILPAKSDKKKKVKDHPRNSNQFETKILLILVVQIVLWYLDSGYSKHLMGNCSRLKNFVKKFSGTVKFENDRFGAIIGYGDYVIDLEVAFRKHSCYVRDVDGVELLKGYRSSNLYTIFVEDMMKSSPICLLSKASKNKSWLWNHRLNHLNFGTINDLTRKDLVRGLPRLKFEKDHICSACKLGKSKKYTHKPKSKNTIKEVLHTLHMDLCEPMRVQSINRKKYILVIIDDYSRFTWVKFLRSKDEMSEFVIKFLKQIQVGLNKTVRYICTDNGTKFVNKL